MATAHDVANGLDTITFALAIGLALAAGVTLGQFIARPRPGRAPAALTKECADDHVGVIDTLQVRWVLACQSWSVASQLAAAP